MSNQSGRLFIVATPIGNLGDITERAREILAGVDRVAVEDTRHSGRLLAKLGIRRPLLSVHEHNELSRVDQVIEKIHGGEDIALISDAGTPLISDPGYRLVKAAKAAAIEVLTIPGPSSVMAALSVSGLPTDRFTFEGFLPARAAARQRRLKALARLEQTLVLLEAGRRVPQALHDLAHALGPNREAALCRELTKRFETTETDTLERLIQWIAADSDRTRGEFVIVVAAGESANAIEHAELPPITEILSLLRHEGLGAKAAARVAARLTGQSANALYTLAIAAGSDATKPSD
ncbi:MAG: 16S rRNA (cytidine(1402)-2'-O)-methyltransferase [Spiribacter sp.]|nr:16S rRNA (cytidine(1402)-2'-O)-methyltransferase [Spiribacter sp.]MDR9489472.1 16S rRNA (cytidine(1402)-2'-O)-methyltransferase [Spiribacter sp.]